MKNVKNIFILGGANLFAHETIKYALENGYRVRAIDLIKREDLKDNEKLEYILDDFFSLPDQKALRLMAGFDSFIYAGGVDDLTVPRRPAGKFFYERNVLTTGRAARLARKAGVKNFLLLGDYRTEIAEKNPELRKYDYHKEPYINTKSMQESIAIYEGEGAMNVSILRPGVIIGKDKKSIITAHINLIKSLKDIVATKGSFPIISAKTLAQAAIYALELEEDKKTYALESASITYEDLYKKIIKVLDLKDKKLSVKSFDDLKEIYKKDEEYTKRKGLEHGIGQINLLRSSEMDLSISSDFDLADDNLDSDLVEMIEFLNA